MPHVKKIDKYDISQVPHRNMWCIYSEHNAKKLYFYLQSFTLNWHAENTHLKNHENEQYLYACLLHFVKVSEFLQFFCFLKPRKLETYRNLVHNRNLGIPGDIYSGQNSHTGHCSCSHSRGSSS